MEGTSAKPAQKSTQKVVHKPADYADVMVSVSSADDFSVPKINITWSNQKTEILYPSDVRRRLKYLIGRVAGLKIKQANQSKMFFDCTVLYHALNAEVNEKDLGIKSKKKKEVFRLLQASSKPM